MKNCYFGRLPRVFQKHLVLDSLGTCDNFLAHLFGIVSYVQISKENLRSNFCLIELSVSKLSPQIVKKITKFSDNFFYSEDLFDLI